MAFNLIVIAGPTATGKTRIAAMLAHKLGSEIISADSRQVYRGMDIGTGKDLNDYIVDGQKIPYHLVDIVDAGYKYNVFEYQRDFFKVYDQLIKRGVAPILCGGTGLYIESVIKNYKLIEVPPDEKLRHELENYTLEELTLMLAKMKKLHNTTDVDTKKRAIRAIEIELYYQHHHIDKTDNQPIIPVIFAIRFPRHELRQRITNRLTQRLKNGMIEEAQKLLNSGLQLNEMEYYGLEYKYMAYYLAGKISYEMMVERLNTAIHQFAKRQDTWFRRMERQGSEIHWIDGHLPDSEKVDTALKIIAKNR